MTTVHLFGLDFEATHDAAGVAQSLLAPPVHSGVWRAVVTPNVDHIVRYERSAADKEVAARAAVVLADGMPLVWASRVLRRPIAHRVTGSDVFAVMWPRLKQEGRTVVVVAATAEIGRLLQADHPSAHVLVAPRLEPGDVSAVEAFVADLVGVVDTVRAEYVVLGLGYHGNHTLAAGILGGRAPSSGSPAILLFGAAVEFQLGLQRRAPEFMRRHGLEWLFRLAREPKRLARRYLVDDPWFLVIVWREWRNRARGGAR